MKFRQLLVALLIVSMALVPASLPAARSATVAGAQTMSVYVAGSNAAWFVSLGGVNVSNPRVAAAEAAPGVSWYNLTAIDTAGWVSDFQVFGPQGYNVLPVPFVPLQGVFLTVGAPSYGDAAAAAGGFGAYLLTSFRSTSNSSGVFTFFAPFQFKALAPSTIDALVPFNTTGFTQALTAAGFDSLPSQLVTLEGVRGPSGFTHGVVVGSIATNALDTEHRPSIPSLFGSSPKFIEAANGSASSAVIVHFLDGLPSSTDSAATVVADRATYSGSYTLDLTPGERVYQLNVTVSQQPPLLLATRVIDVGVLKTGSNMSVTLSLSDLSNSTGLSGITLNDNWWQPSGLFRLVSGSSNLTGLNLNPGSSSTPTYVLQYVGNATEQFQLPATTVSYAFLTGPTLFHAYTTLNPITISLGADAPVVYAYLTPAAKMGRSVGVSQPLKVVVKNVGTRTASSVTVGGQQLGGLAPGDEASASFSVAAPSLVDANATGRYLVSYTTPEGSAGSATTNALPVDFGHDSMSIAFATLSANSTVVEGAGGTPVMNLTLDFANLGKATVTSFSAQAPLPQGLGCGTAGGVNFTCSGGQLSIHYTGVLAGGQEHAFMAFNVTQPRNYIFWPFTTGLSSSGYQLAAHTNAAPAPAGVVLSKQFSPSPLFIGMSSTVTVNAANAGPYDIYNASVYTIADSFDQTPGSTSTTGSRSNLTAGSNFSYTYGIKAVSSGGNTRATAVTSTFYLGGSSFSVTWNGPTVSVYDVIRSSVTTSPASPTEGRPFTIVVTLTNPAAVAVGNVQFFLPVPSGVSLSNSVNATVSGGGLNVDLAQMGAGATYTARVNATAGSGQTIPFAGATLGFSYGGASLKGTVPSAGIAVGENVLLRYELPLALVILALLATAFYVRKLVRVSAPASQN